MKKIIILIIVMLTIQILPAKAFNSLFSDHKSFSIGDVLTVEIIEKSTASTSSKNESNKSFNHAANTPAGTGPLDFIPLASMGIASSNAASGDATSSRNGTLESKMTVVIRSIDQNGNLRIKGAKSIKINGETQITELEGIVRQEDVQANNTIFSYNIANAKLSYRGKGAVNEGSRIGLLSRIFNFIF